VSSGIARRATAIDHVTFRHQGRTVQVSGRVEVEAVDGGLLLLAPDGVLWGIQPDDQIERRHDEQAFEPYDRKQLSDALLREMPAGFQIHNTAHYVICYNTSEAYARWCGELYERLLRGFMNYWTRRKLDLYPPKTPLVALVFDSREAYADYARPELGDAARTIVGYYSLRSNRVIMFDLTGVEQLGSPSARRGRRIEQILSQPNALPTVATIVHEAVHQVAFNCGLHQRYAEIPIWLSEGLAMVFETPDLGSSRGWRGMRINTTRLRRFHRYARQRSAHSLRSMLSGDDDFHDPRRTADVYAEAWAFCYYLMKRHAAEFSEYLRWTSRQQPLISVDGEQRVQVLLEILDTELDQLETDFLRYIDRLK
jgi:hypothetical protein